MDKDIEQKRKEFKEKRAEENRKRQALEESLAEKYPFMRRGADVKEQKANGRIHDLYGAFGCEVGSGWYELLHSLCMEITVAYEKSGQPVDLVIDQVKEKFGTLRFYYHPIGKDPGVHAIDFLGAGSLRMRAGDSELHQEVAQIVRKWEEQSGYVCENCSAPGELRKDIGWIQTLCDSCYAPVKQRAEERKNQKKDKERAEANELMDNKS